MFNPNGVHTYSCKVRQCVCGVCIMCVCTGSCVGVRVCNVWCACVCVLEEEGMEETAALIRPSLVLR